MDDRTDPQYKLRMPSELHKKLKDAAKDNHRSMNAEIVARLEDSFSRENFGSEHGVEYEPLRISLKSGISVDDRSIEQLQESLKNTIETIEYMKSRYQEE